MSSARSVSSALMPAASSAPFRPISSVVSDFILTTLGCAVAANDVDDDRVRLRGVGGPVDVAAGGLHARLELQEVLVEPPEHVVLDLAARLAQLLPVVELGDDAGPLRADRPRDVAQVGAELLVLQLRAGRRREAVLAAHDRPRSPAVPPTRRRRPRLRQDLREVHRPHPAPHPAQPAADVQQARGVHGGAELGPGRDHVAALVGEHRQRGVGVLDGERAAEAAALLGLGQVDQLKAPHRAQQAERRVADLRDALRVAGGMAGHAVREGGADVLHAQAPHEELGELEDALAQLTSLALEALVAGFARERRIHLADRADARRRGRDDDLARRGTSRRSAARA